MNYALESASIADISILRIGIDSQGIIGFSGKNSLKSQFRAVFELGRQARKDENSIDRAGTRAGSYGFRICFPGSLRASIGLVIIVKWAHRYAPLRLTA